MPLVLKDRVQETSTTTGTGTLTLSGAVSGYQTFSTAIGNTNTTYYTIKDASGSNWEVGLGTVSAGALARTTVLASSNAGSLVNFTSGSLVVFCGYPADKSVYGNGTTLVAPSGTILPIANGGTNATATPTLGGVIVGTGTAYSSTAAGTSGQVLTSNGASAPTWTTPSGGSLLGITDAASPQNTALGYLAGTNQSTQGQSNVTIGYQTGTNVRGTLNVIIGANSAQNILSNGDDNIVVGAGSANALSTGRRNCILGSRAIGLTTGSQNFVGGLFALNSLTTGSNNVALGFGAMSQATTSSSSIAIGDQALQFVGTTSNNVAIGGFALQQTTGQNNVALGRSAGSNLTSGSSNIVIGHNASASSATVNNEFTHGNSSITSNRFWGDFKMGGSSAGTSGQVLTSAGAGVSPTWTTVGGGGSSSLTIDNKTAAYTIVTGDLGKVINCTSGTFTVSLTAAATLGSGFNVTIWNTSSTSTHVITIDPNDAETIDGSATITLRLGEGTEIVSNGTNWITGNKKSMMYYAENATTLLRPVASGASSIAMGNGGYASGSNAIAIGNSRVDGVVGAKDTGTIAIGSGSSAAGSYCVSIGQDSSASNLRSVAIGLSAYATANFSVAVGAAASASNDDATSIGAYSIANKVDATALGAYANASGIESTSIGSYSNATQNDATALGSYANALQPYATSIGYNAYNNTVKNKYTFGSAWSKTFGTQDTASAGKYILGASTTDATTTVLTTISGAVASTNQLTLPDRAVVCFTGQVVCRTSGTVSSAWKIEGLIRRDTGVATTTLIASTVTDISNASGFTVALAADTTYGCLKISVTGAAATSLRWLATVETTEVKN